MRSFDELIEFLLDEVAFCGEKGASASDFQNFVHKFYKDDVTTSNHLVVDPVLSSPVVDRKLVEKAWGWLTAHPDIWVGKNSSDNAVSLEEAEAREMENEAATGAITATTVETGQSESAKSNTEQIKQTTSPHNPLPPRPSFRVFTSQERMWQAVTGHGVDLKRVPAMEFQILSTIAAAGPPGITQPDIVRNVGQDKRSVPKRTDRLAENGYIIKKVVYLKGQKTSLCTHIRFTRAKDGTTVTSQGRSAADVFVDGKLVLDHFLDYLVGRCNDGSIQTTSLISELGIEKKKWERVMVSKCLDRLEIIGVIQRFRAFVRISTYGKKLIPSIKLLHQPTEEDRKRYHLLTNKERKEFREKLEAQDAARWANERDVTHSTLADESISDSSSVVQEDLDLVEDIDDSASVTQEQNDKTPDQHIQQQLVAQWDPDIPYANTIYDAVHAAGKNGLTSADVRCRTYGDFYQRSFDNMLGRLSDDWEHSQPKNLMHLALVRDTTIINRANLYLYRTYPNFEKAVEAGDAEWDAVRASKTTNSMATTRLDRWGFPTVSTTDLLKADGSASLAEVYNAVGSGKDRTEYSGPSLEKDENGNDLIVWPLPLVRGLPKKRKRMDSEEITSVPTPSKTEDSRMNLNTSRDSTTKLSVSAQASTSNQVPTRPETVKGMTWKEYNRQYREKRSQEKLAEKRAEQIRRHAEWLADQAEKVSQQQPNGAPIVNQALSIVPTLSQPSTPNNKLPKKRGRPRKDSDGDARKKQRLDHPQENNESFPTSSPSAQNNIDSSPIASVRPIRMNAEQKKNREERIEEFIRQLSDSSRCGVHIDPPHSRPHLEGVSMGRGRPRKGCVVVFKFAWLKHLEWFKNNPGTHLPKKRNDADNSAVILANTSRVMNIADGSEISVAAAVAEEDHVSARSAITSTPLEVVQKIDVDSCSILETDQHQNSLEVAANQSTSSVESDWLIDFTENWEVLILGRKSDLDMKELQSLARRPCKARGKKRRGRKAKRCKTVSKPFDVAELETATLDISTGPQEVIALESVSSENLNQPTRKNAEVDVDIADLTQIDDRIKQRVENEEQVVAQDTDSYDLREHVTASKRRKRGVGLGGGSLRAKRIAIILDIVDKCGGIFGGDTEIIRPFQDAQQALQPDTMTDRDTILKALKAAVSDGKLRRVTFAFVDKNDVPITKHLVLRPHVKFEDAIAVEFRRKIEELYPVQWIPGHVLTRKRRGIDAGAPRKKVISRYITIEEESEFKPETEAQWILDHRKRQEDMEKRREERKLAAIGQLRRNQLDLPRTDRGRLRRLERVIIEKKRQEDKIKQKEHKQTTKAVAEVAQFEAEEAMIPGRAILQLRGNPKTNWITEEMQHQVSSTQGLKGQPLFEMMAAEQLATIGKTPRLHSHGPLKPWERFAVQSGLIAPLQQFHAPTGTFSTHFNKRIGNKSRWPSAQAILGSWKDRHASLSTSGRRPTGANRMIEPVEQLPEEELQEWQNEGYGLRLSNHHDSASQPNIQNLQFVNYALDHDHVTAKSLEPNESNHYAYQLGNHFTLYGQPNEAPPTDVTLVPHPTGRRIRAFALRPWPYGCSIEFDSPPAGHGVGVTSSGPVAQSLSLAPLAETSRKDSTQKGKRKSGPRVPRAHKPAKGDPTCVITPDAAKRLLFAVIAVRALVGGPSQTIHWTIINRLFENYPNFDPTTFRKRWAIMLQYHKEIVERVETAFQNAFLAAYDNDEVPRLDNEHPENYDWDFIVKWARDNVMIDSRDLNLPAGRQEFDKKFVIRQHDRDESEASLREDMYREMSTLIYRERAVKDLEFSVLVSTSTFNPSLDSFETHDLAVAKSWARASIATPSDRYNARQCLTKLNSLGDQLLTRAITELQEEKMIVHNFRGRDHPDKRNYHLAEQYSTTNPKRSTLVRYLQREHYIEAITFKRKLDQLFVHENEDERVCHVPELVRDSEVLCITELMVNGRVKIVHKLPEINSTLGERSRRITVWGGLSGDDSYNYSGGKHVDKELLKWGVEIRPTETYIMGFPMEDMIKSVEPPMAPKTDEKGRERIPFWVDVHGGFLKDNWENVLLAVVYCVSVRAGSTLETITKSFKGIMWEWEIELVMDWLMEVCLARWSFEIGQKDRTSDGNTLSDKKKAGAIVNEWWWTLLAGAETE